MASAVASVRRFLAASSGVTAIEYGLVAAAMGAAIALGSDQLASALSSSFELITEAMNSDESPLIIAVDQRGVSAD
jgi:Flp pilus assembly pilin Flp